MHGSGESLLHIGGVLGAGLEVRQIAIGRAPRVCVLRGHLVFVQVHLVANDNEREVSRVLDVSEVEKLAAPHGEVFEAPYIVQGERQEAAVRPAIERCAHALEAFLTRRVPDLNTDARQSLILPAVMDLTKGERGTGGGGGRRERQAEVQGNLPE